MMQHWARLGCHEQAIIFCSVVTDKSFENVSEFKYSGKTATVRITICFRTLITPVSSLTPMCKTFLETFVVTQLANKFPYFM